MRFIDDPKNRQQKGVQIIKTKYLTSVLALFLLISTTTATIDAPKVNQADTNNLDIQQGELEKTNFLDQISGLLSFTGVSDTYEPGDRIEVDISATATETFNAKGGARVVEVYKCADSTCETPPPIDSSSEDQCDTSEWSPDYDDCVAKSENDVNYDITLVEDNTWSWGVGFDGFQEEGTYILVGYIWDNGIKTDISKEKFTVQSSYGGDGTDDITSSGGPEPTSLSDPSVTVDGSDIRGDFLIKNTGDTDMTSSNIVEMQVRPQGSGLLSVLGSDDDRVCDISHRENQYDTYELDSGEEKRFSITVPTENVGPGQYDVWAVSYTSCYGEGSHEPVGIFNGGHTHKVGQVTVQENTDTGGGGGGTGGGSGGSSIITNPIFLIGLAVIAVGGYYRWRE